MLDVIHAFFQIGLDRKVKVILGRNVSTDHRKAPCGAHTGLLYRKESYPSIGPHCRPQAHRVASFCVWNPRAKLRAQYMENAISPPWMNVLETPPPPHRFLSLPKVTGRFFSFRRLSILDHFENNTSQGAPQVFRLHSW